MICQCGNQTAIRMRIYFDEKGNASEVCEKCGELDNTNGCPDVFFERPYLDEHLTDDAHKNGIYVESKRHKAQLLKERGLREAGSDINPRLGRPMPFIKDPERRRRFMIDNFGEK